MQTSSLPNGTHTTDKSTSATANDVAAAAQAVLKPSVAMPSTSTQIHGVDFSDYTNNITVAQLTKHFSSTGFQASNLGRAIEIINNMVPHTISRMHGLNPCLRDAGNPVICPKTRTTKTKNPLPRTQNAPSSSATPQTSSPPASAKQSATSSSTTTSPLSSPPQAASKRTSSSVLPRRTWAPFRCPDGSCGRRG
jgi:hypothetical protein